jgi:single-strand DNA-binding protein
MAADMNTVNLVGRCARTPELKSSGTSSVLKIRLAFTTQRKVGDRWEDQPNYVDVTTFGRRAEALAGLLDKGDRIGITGRLSWREWESKDGKRQAIEVLADDVQLLGAPRGRDDAPASDLPIAPAPVQPVPDATDDIPF